VKKVKEVDYHKMAKEIFLKGFATVKEVKWLASKLEKADNFDKIKSLVPNEMIDKIKMLLSVEVTV